MKFSAKLYSRLFIGSPFDHINDTHVVGIFVHSLIVDVISLCQSSGFRNMCNALSHIENKDKFCTALTTQENILTLLTPLFNVSQIETLCRYLRRLTCVLQTNRKGSDQPLHFNLDGSTKIRKFMRLQTLNGTTVYPLYVELVRR